VDHAQTYEVSINVSIRPKEPYYSYPGGNLEVRESLTVAADNFMAVAKILGQFHDLAESLRTPDAG
jgi:hypothetical protein